MVQHVSNYIVTGCEKMLNLTCYEIDPKLNNNQIQFIVPIFKWLNDNWKSLEFTYPIEKSCWNTSLTDVDIVYINSEHSGKHLGHIISEFPLLLFGNRLLNIPKSIKIVETT